MCDLILELYTEWFLYYDPIIFSEDFKSIWFFFLIIMGIDWTLF